MINIGPLNKVVCIQCGREPYKRKGITYKLCSQCGWDALMTLLEQSEEEEQQNVDEYLRNNGYDPEKIAKEIETLVSKLVARRNEKEGLPTEERLRNWWTNALS